MLQPLRNIITGKQYGPDIFSMLSWKCGILTAAAVILITFSAAPSSAEELPCRILPGCGSELSRFLPESRTGRGKFYILGGKASSLFTYSMKIDRSTGRVVYTARSNLHTAESVLDGSLLPIKSSFRFNEAAAKADPEIVKLFHLVKFDERKLKRDHEGKKIILSYFRSGELRSTKEFSYDWGYIDADHTALCLQAILLSGQFKDFSVDMFIPASGLMVGVELGITETSDLAEYTSPYPAPRDMLEVFVPGKKYILFTIRPTGLKGIFAKFMGIRYYAVFESVRPYNFVAFWGGKTGHEEFSFILPDENGTANPAKKNEKNR